MNYELLLALGTSVGALVLAFLYARASKGAAVTDQYKAIAKYSIAAADDARALAAAKEDYIRELEKTVVGSLPPGKLVDRLNLLFAAERTRGKASAVQTPKPVSGTTKP